MLFERLLTQLRDHAVVLLDTDGRITAWRGAAERIFGHAEAAVLGQDVALLFTPEDQARGLPALEREVAASGGRSEDDRWHLRQDGVRIWITGTVTAVRDDDGTLLAFAKVMCDRTDLRAHIETLENRITQLQASHHDKDVFFARLSHEVRNSLAPLRNATELIGRTSDPAQLAFTLGVVQRQLALLGRMAEDLAAMARLGAGKLPLALEPVSLNQRMLEVVETARDHVQRKEQEVRILLPANPVRVLADPQRLQQILYNLLNNAVKYTPCRGRIWLKLAVEGPDAVVRIEDSGDGIPGELLPRIFDMFTQGDDRHAEGGFGVGLSLVKDLVHAHGGTVEVRSRGAGQGSEFTVRLPLAPPEDGAEGAAAGE